MNYFIFNFKKHIHLISSFLESASIAHKHNKVKTEDWFFWKFRDNPFGETILACAEENRKIVGCVAYGMQPFLLNEGKFKGILSFETFVHPKFQGLGVFSKLIKLAEEEATKLGVDFMLNFPNSNSLRGFLKSSWQKLDSPEYWIKTKNIFKTFLNITDLKKAFQPDPSNLLSLETPESYTQSSKTDRLSSVINLDYLNWRFFSHPVAHYDIIDTNEFYAILRVGRRGKLREVQLLFINPKQGQSIKIKKFLRTCKAKVNYDIISFPISKNNPVRSELKNNLFIKVPNRTNICYKILSTDKITEEQVRLISLNAINYHTY